MLSSYAFSFITPFSELGNNLGYRLNLRSSLHEIVPEGGWQGPEAGHISFETSSTNLSTFIVQSTDSSVSLMTHLHHIAVFLTIPCLQGPTQSIGGKAERSPFQHTNSHPVSLRYCLISVLESHTNNLSSLAVGFITFIYKSYGLLLLA